MGPVLIAVALLAAACGDDDASSTRTGSSTSGGGGGGGGGEGAASSSSSSSSASAAATANAASSTSSVGGAGGGGGGAPSEPHSVELVLGMLAGGEEASATILVNAVDGTLKMHFLGSQLPVSVDLLDGDFVTLLSGVSQVLSTRVAPDVERIAMGSAPFDITCADGEMIVQIDVPEVPGATRYELITFRDPPMISPEPGLMEVTARACFGREEATVLVVAYDGESVLAHETVSIPFEDGAEVVTSVALEAAPRETLSIDVESFEGARSLLAYGEWQMYGRSILEPEHILQLDSPGGSSLSFAPEVIAPGFGFHRLKVSIEAAPMGRVCPRSSFHRFGTAPWGPAHFDAAALRLAIEHEDGTWGWEGTGALGDTVSRVFRSGDDWWVLREHPDHPDWPAVVPELPDGAPLPPFGFLDIRHVAYDERDGYADEVGTLATVGVSITTRVLVTELCGP